ncbi:4-hydroxyphenylpyruvate dioxygenase [Uliginosibacterium sp. H3]|uniref:4-hydroxyphenylpyruvate dioxygenase n=1 Tax=Uliginosibacterium silvisoli TaxID=3114758 RepID=A0ABU6K2T8_9RHOO|nr:4-hydroxyphenylpyruvate dioxygenase [Uliginosibacterium sp. H3]
MNALTSGREIVPEASNPIGIAGIEFIEYATRQPQALGRVLEAMGFQAVARHRSREILLYRQGTMNLVVNAHADDARVSATEGGTPVISALAFRVRDAQQAHARCIELGAWEVASHARAMELHIPAIHGPGGSRFYFVDRWQEFSIYDVDFVPIQGANPAPPAIAGMHYFGMVQYVGAGRGLDWSVYYERMFGFEPISNEERFGIMPKGMLMRSPASSAGDSFLWQLVEPFAGVEDEELVNESLQRIGIGAPDVPGAVAALSARGVDFVDSTELHPEDRGALTRAALGSVAFELVHQSA